MTGANRNCFWLRLAVAAAAAAFIKADAHSAQPSDSSRQSERAVQDGSQKERRRAPSEHERNSPASTFFALRLEVQDSPSGLLRLITPRAPVTGLHQPVTRPLVADRHSLVIDDEFQADIDIVRTCALPIVRHGPPIA